MGEGKRMSGRIRVTHLTFVGHGRPGATVEFGPNVTIIRGPSDTGKSFIANSIDYMLGAKSLREIPQLAGYSSALLGLSLPNGELVTLSRRVTGGDFTVYSGAHFSIPADQDGFNRGATHSARGGGGLSNFILDALGLDGLKLRKNSNNKKISFTLRHLAHLTIIGETRIQSRTAPPLTGQRIERTSEFSALKLLLLGEDDSALVEVAPPAEQRTIGRAKDEVVGQLLAKARSQVEKQPNAAELHAQLARLKATIGAAGDEIDGATRARVTAAQRLAGLLSARTEVQGRAHEIEGLISRFALLAQQYDSDLARLEMVSEAGNLLGYYLSATCPFCGAEPEHQHSNLEYDTQTTAFAAAIASEFSKTEALRGDLQRAIQDLKSDADRLRARNLEIAEEIQMGELALRTADEALRPRKVKFDELLRTRSSIEAAIAVHRQISDLESMRAQVSDEAEPKKAEAPAPLPLAVSTQLSAAIQSRLRDWGFRGAESVRFDRSEFDIIDADQLRGSHGKGVRAILHAAFTLALADFCLANNLPHPGFVVLDSPLVTYKPPKEGEVQEVDDESPRRLDDSFVARFYRNLQQETNVQIIIMENTDPPESISANTVDVEFTDSSEGRRGFLAPTLKGE